MERWIRLRAIAAVTLLAAASCSDGNESTGPDGYSAVGVWTGIVYGATLTVGLKEEGTRLTGGGSLSSSSESIPFTIYGKNERNVVSFIMRNNDYLEATFTGKLENSTTMTGRLNRSGFDNDPITLTKQ